MKFLPETELYRYQIIATLFSWLVYSIAFYFTGDVAVAFAVAFAFAVAGAFAGAGAFAVAFAGAFAGAFAVAFADDKEFPHSAKVFFSLLLEEAAIIWLFYISSHLQIHFSISWM
ncbi:MAG: hypothetical protein AAB657_03380 [Patescibacteria group bacterium]